MDSFQDSTYYQMFPNLIQHFRVGFINQTLQIFQKIPSIFPPDVAFSLRAVHGTPLVSLCNAFRKLGLFHQKSFSARLLECSGYQMMISGVEVQNIATPRPFWLLFFVSIKRFSSSRLLEKG